MTVYEGTLNGEGIRIAIVVSRFNRFISEQLLAGALDGLQRHGVRNDLVDCAWVPGSFEIPLLAKRLTASHDAIICLGAVIRGATAHFDYVAGETASGIAAVARETGVPIAFGVLTTDTMEQAIDRAGGKLGNKGYDAALSAIEMVNLLRTLPSV